MLSILMGIEENGVFQISADMELKLTLYGIYGKRHLYFNVKNLSWHTLRIKINKGIFNSTQILYEKSLCSVKKKTFTKCSILQLESVVAFYIKTSTSYLVLYKKDLFSPVSISSGLQRENFVVFYE